MAIQMKLSAPGNLKKYVRALKPLVKHHYFAYSLILLCGLVVAVFMINQTLTAPSDDTYRTEKLSSGVNANFNQQTIKKIEELKRSNESGAIEATPPAGTRTNPFSE